LTDADSIAMMDSMSEDYDPFQELEAMKNVAQLLRGMPPVAILRVLAWVRTALTLGSMPESTEIAKEVGETERPSTAGPLVDLFGRLAPNTGPARALLVGYWLQVLKGQEDFDGKSVNDELKNLGHGLANVTATMTALMSQRPALVIQTKKAGVSQQARKRYRLTHEGEETPNDPPLLK
jgi:hypothetical protein